MLGPTKVYKAQFEDPYSLRGMFGLSDTRNVAHGSGSTIYPQFVLYLYTCIFFLHVLKYGNFNKLTETVQN